MVKDGTNEDIIQASKDGNLLYLQSISMESVRKAKCHVGCTALHWAAGSNQLTLLKYFLTENGTATATTSSINRSSSSHVIFSNVNLVVSENKLAAGRTPLHYACRNGHLEVAKYLIQVHSANVHVKDHKGVTPFQLAIWQNHLDICRFLVEDCNIVASLDVNSFGCGPIHWLGIVPFHRANDNSSSCITPPEEDGNALLPLADFLTSQPNISVFAKQNTGHTALHKAAWGGHFALVKYLHERFHMYDDCIDDTGNYAADLADMANTERHSRIARYLRRECSMERVESLKVLGLVGKEDMRMCSGSSSRMSDDCSNTANYTMDDIRRAYLQKAKIYHPDVRRNDDDDNDDELLNKKKFHEIQTAYEHLTIHGGISSNQRNPAHCIPLLLQLQQESKEQSMNLIDTSVDENEKQLFKARLLAVLLEYGNKGMNLSNIPKKWDQVWPDVPFDSMFTHERNTESSRKKRRGGELLRLIQSRAGDVIKIIRQPLNHDIENTTSVSKTQQKKGVILIMPRNATREDVALLDQSPTNQCDHVSTDI